MIFRFLRKKTNRIHVLYVEENQDGTIGGSYYSLLDLIREIDSSRIKVTVMFYERHPLLDAFHRNGVHVHIFPKLTPLRIDSKIKNKNIPFREIILSAAVPLQKIINFFRVTVYSFLIFVFFIIKHHVDIIHINNSVFVGFEWVLASKFTRRKIVTHHREYWREIPYGCGWHCHKFDFIFGISEAVRRNLKLLGIELNRYSTVYNKIDVKGFRNSVTKSPKEIKKKFGIGEHDPLVGIIGNLQRWKGQDVIVESILKVRNKIPNIRCLLVGDISLRKNDDFIYYQELDEKIKSNNLSDNIIITGYRQDISNLINAVDILLHASKDPEPLGRVVLEGMTMGKPVIAARLGGPLEIIDEGDDGMLANPKLPEEYAEKMLVLLSDAKLRNKMGRAAYNKVFTQFSKMDTNKIISVYESLIKK